MKKKPTVINSFEQLNEVLISPTVKQEPTGAINKPVTETKRVSLLAKSKRRY